jgi:hypothetical protein
MPSGCPPTAIGIDTAPVAGSIRTTVSSAVLATHTPLGPLAIAVGRLPTRIGCPTTVFEDASISETVPSPPLTTHTSPPVTAIAVGELPTPMVCTTACVCGLMRDTVPSLSLLTHTAPAPYASPSGPCPTGISLRRLPSALRMPTLFAGGAGALEPGE